MTTSDFSRRAASWPDYPVRDALPNLRRALDAGGVAVLAAPPGSGKTTLVPLLLLNEPWLANQRIVMLEPRRVAARAAAARMASLLGEKVGETVGYQIRFERKVSAATRIEVVTEGLLTRRLQADAELPGVGLIIFDEFHERSLDADLALALTLDVRANLRPELKVLVMSATLDTQRVSDLLGGAPIIESQGRMFPVDVRYAPPRAGAPIDAAVAEGVSTALAETSGDVLAFLPGAREIRGAQRLLESRYPQVGVYPLYGELSSAEQDAALQPDVSGRRKVILATNIAQTSLTVEGVTTVVDAGWVRAARFDLGAGANRLDTLRVSRASADQRAGRAGRLGPGTAYRLWSRDQQGSIAAHDTPEMLSADLSRAVMDLAAWGVRDPSDLALLDQPPRASWSYAVDLLTALGALDAKGVVTAHGKALSRVPTTPRLAHMLLKAKESGHAEEAAWIAALLDERATETDLAMLFERYRAGRAEPPALRRVRESVGQFLRVIGVDRERDVAVGAVDREMFDRVGRWVALAYPERLARRREGAREGRGGAAEASFLCADGAEIRMPATDALARSEWLAIAHIDPGPPRRVRLAAAVEQSDVLRDAADQIKTIDEIRWDSVSHTVVAERQQRLGAIVLERKLLRDGATEAVREAIRAAMLQGIRELGIEALPWGDNSRQWQARVQSLRAWRSSESWPEVSDAALLADLELWLAPWLDGVSRRDHLSRLDLMSILNGMLEYPQQQALARLAPTHIEVPSGSNIAIDYSADAAPPILSVKLQELFGLTVTPAVNEGRTPLSLHLLSPGRRPIQVTQDLAGFWARTYQEVKKELKGRYPRHPWPDDPLTALPTAKTKKALR